MARKYRVALTLCSALLFAGCSFTADTLWPALTGGDPAGKVQAAPTAATGQPGTFPIAPSPGERGGQPLIAPGAPPTLGTTTFVAPGITPGKSTGTFVGQKVVMLRGELRRMQQGIGLHNGRLQQVRSQTSQHSQRYHGTIAAINAKLQVGTTPGNPFLVQHWRSAQNELARIDADVAQMNSLANDVAGTSTMSAYLLETTRASYGLSGAVDEDHRQLAILEDEVNRTVVLIERLLNELTEDINRQTTYIGNERGSLTTLSLAIKNGEMLGASLGRRGMISSAPSLTAQYSTPPRGAAVPGGRRPLVVIRFDRANVAYEQALYTAVNRVLERRPDAAFDLVAVAPGQGSPAKVTVAANKSKRYAEKVLRSLSNMGMPLERVRLSAITSAASDTNEVHVYLR
jgi:hypothetical protein